jgi:DNA (cytosine-5)-methyltransferase 1
LEASGYAIGAADLCAAGIGAPHIRQRLWFVGERLDDTASARHDRALAGSEGEARNEARLRLSGEGRGSGGLADAQGQRYLQREVGDEDGAQRPLSGGGEDERLRQPGPSGASGNERVADTPLNGRRQGVEDGGRLRSGDSAEGTAGRSALDSDVSGGLADADSTGSQPGKRHDQAARHRHPVAAAGSNGRLADACNDGPQGRVHGGAHEERQALDGSAGRDGADRWPSPTNGHWRDADWLFCRDGKWRPVEPGTFPLAHGAPARVGRLRAYGNAIVPALAAEIIAAFMEARP